MNSKSKLQILKPDGMIVDKESRKEAYNYSLPGTSMLEQAQIRKEESSRNQSSNRSVSVRNYRRKSHKVGGRFDLHSSQNYSNAPQ